MIQANIVLDSISHTGVRLTTLSLLYPRFIHSEFMTHRVFSRNASSSRAVPVRKVIGAIREYQAMPVSWGQNKPGMQAGDEVANPDLAKSLWLEAAEQACAMAERMADLNLHKQIVNRILEPFSYIHVLVTSTEWDNFFMLRCHPDAQPEIQNLAVIMREVMRMNSPVERGLGEWHLPYVNDNDLKYDIDTLKKISTARCARVSYVNHDGSPPNVDKDLILYHKLISAHPMHASPCEHQATPLECPDWYSGNFRGWQQFRKTFE